MSCWQRRDHNMLDQLQYMRTPPPGADAAAAGERPTAGRRRQQRAARSMSPRGDVWRGARAQRRHLLGVHRASRWL